MDRPGGVGEEGVGVDGLERVGGVDCRGGVGGEESKSSN